jgi:hypothetical protein
MELTPYTASIFMAEAVEQAVRKCCEYASGDMDTFYDAYNQTTRLAMSIVDRHELGVRAVLAAHLAKALPEEKKTPEERVKIKYAVGRNTTQVVCTLDGEEKGPYFQNNIECEIYRRGLIATLAAQGGDHA